MGQVQRACLKAVEEYERDGHLPTTYSITAEVYAVPRDKDGNRWVTDAQHSAVRRALYGLQRQGLLIGFRTHQCRAPGDGRTELSHHWMTEARLVKWLAEEERGLQLAAEFRAQHGLGEMPSKHRQEIERIAAKATAIGMQPRGQGPEDAS
jgi:hypothetical protein